MPLPSLQDDALVAYQIAFDLYESATQHFLRRVQEEIQASLPSPPPPSTPSHNQGGDKLSVPVQETGGGEKSVEWGSDGRETPSVPVQETGAGGRGEQRKGGRRKGEGRRGKGERENWEGGRRKGGTGKRGRRKGRRRKGEGGKGEGGRGKGMVKCDWNEGVIICASNVNFGGRGEKENQLCEWEEVRKLTGANYLHFHIVLIFLRWSSGASSGTCCHGDSSW